MSTKKEKKALYFEKVAKLFQEYHKIMIVNVDNVSSSLMQQARHALRGKAVVLMGKNTLIRRAMSSLKNIPGIAALSASLKLNVGLIFTNDELSVVRDIIAKNKISGPAKPGQVAPIDVVIPKGGTGLEPGQTSFLQALNISSKITKGTIEILNDVKVITKGQIVGSSEAALLQKLKITPFFFEIAPQFIFEDGQIFPISTLDITQDDLANAFISQNQKMVAFCMGFGSTPPGAIPYFLRDGFRNICAFSAAIGYTVPLAQKALSAAAAAPVASKAKEAKVEKKEAPKKEEKKKEEKKEEEEEQDLGGLFDF